MYINAYLDENCYHKLEYLIQTTQSNLSEVISEALYFYYERRIQTNRAEKLLQSGFVGCGEAEPTLSENYKSEWSDMMRKKHDNG